MTGRHQEISLEMKKLHVLLGADEWNDIAGQKSNFVFVDSSVWAEPLKKIDNLFSQKTKMNNLTNK